MDRPWSNSKTVAKLITDILVVAQWSACQYNNRVKIDITHIAKLANLPLTDSEKKKLEKQLEETLAYIENLKEVETKGIKPTDHVTGLENVFKNDSARPSFSQEEALQNAKEKHNGFFKVKAILEND